MLFVVCGVGSVCGCGRNVSCQSGGAVVGEKVKRFSFGAKPLDMIGQRGFWIDILKVIEENFAFGAWRSPSMILSWEVLWCDSSSEHSPDKGLGRKGFFTGRLYGEKRKVLA